MKGLARNTEVVGEHFGTSVAKTNFTKSFLVHVPVMKCSVILRILRLEMEHGPKYIYIYIKKTVTPTRFEEGRQFNFIIFFRDPPHGSCK